MNAPESPDKTYIPGHVYRSLNQDGTSLLVLARFHRVALNLPRSTVAYMFVSSATGSSPVGTVQLTDYLTNERWHIHADYPHSESCPCKEDS